jgi:hypothetical protein
VVFWGNVNGTVVSIVQQQTYAMPTETFQLVVDVIVMTFSNSSSYPEANLQYNQVENIIKKCPWFRQFVADFSPGTPGLYPRP